MVLRTRPPVSRDIGVLAAGWRYASITDKIADLVLTRRPGWRWWLLFLATLGGTLVFFCASAYLFAVGVGIWGVNIPVAWGYAIGNFVWWTGIGHAGTFISASSTCCASAWRTSINRFAESMTLFAAGIAGLFPILHLGRPWFFYWLMPYPNVMELWPQWRSPLVWDFFAIATYLTVSLLFWFLRLPSGAQPMAGDRAGMADRVAAAQREFRLRTGRGSRTLRLLADRRRGEAVSVSRPLDSLPAREQRARAGTRGMWVFLATELMFFGPLFFGYWYGRLQFPEAFAAASRETDVILGAANTALLLTSSALMAAAVEAAELRARRHALRLLGATAALGVVFLVVKGVEYRHEWQAGLFPGDASVLYTGGRLFFLLYLAMTGVHALHLAIGIAVVATFVVAGARARPPWGPQQLELVGLYWHFVDAMWIFLFPILYLVGRSG